MDPSDGRVISNFMVNTIMGNPLVIYGDGSPDKKFCYVDDMIEALIKSMDIDFDSPINIGNDNEISLNELANIFTKKYNSIQIKYTPSQEDDPKVRKPVIKRASKILRWKPSTLLIDGLDETYKYFKKLSNDFKNSIVVIPARKNSKRIKGKNLRILNGKPLISHSIEYALKYIDKKYLGKYR